MKRKVITGLRMVPMALVMGTIFFLSQQPGGQLSLPEIPGMDKLAHMAAYGVLAATVIFAFSAQLKSAKPWRVVVLTILFCFLYGLSDEFHQSFVPGRFVSVGDIFADCAGATLSCCFWFSRQKAMHVSSYWRDSLGAFLAKRRP